MYQQLKCRSFAKINLCLHVTNKRNDGYHDIESIFKTINLYDELSFKQNNTDSIRFTSDSEKINPLDNLITKTYKEICNNYDIPGIDVLLKKNIPIGGGLGGGSSNAAATLHALNSLFKLNISSKQLIKIAQKIGSDVPFFINGGSAIVRGRGEKIEEIDLDERFYIIVISDLLIHTKDIFENLRSDSYVDTVKNIDLLKSQHNCLESLVMSKYPSSKRDKILAFLVW
jgi:4-diphosphocytidyl-2-C-methyl-D-erythritol kinase